MPVIDISLVAGIALTAAIITQALRSVWPITILVKKQVKPFACDLCMSCWITLGVGIWYYLDSASPPEPLGFLFWTVLPAMGACLIAITMTNRPVFPDLPDAGDQDEEKGP